VRYSDDTSQVVDRGGIVRHSVVVDTGLADTTEAVARYARLLHRSAGEGHHVASPLGAWILLALCGPASSGAARAELAQALGCEIDRAAAMARALLSEPHPLVAAAAGVWRRRDVDTEALSRWLASLPDPVEAGTLTDQAALDAWARRNTLELIEKFPIDLSPDVLLVLATALATKVSWEEPFDTVPATALGPHSPWASTLSRVLRTPRRGSKHSQFIASTDHVGDVAVHTAWADGGLLVTSVAAQPDVPAADVLAIAYRLASAIATGVPVAKRSLFDLPLGPAPLWDLTERHAHVTAPSGREEHCTAVLPAWAAQSQLNLGADPTLGFDAAAATLAALAGVHRFQYEAQQAAMARYSRTGFEAAAVTGMMVALSARLGQPGVIRNAELRFGHPFAVVAAASQAGSSPWHGLPVFSAWITEPEDAGDQDRVLACGCGCW